MSILPRRVPVRVAAVALVVVAIVVAVVLALVLSNRGVPAPTDSIGDIPTAHLVPEDVVLYVALNTESDSWRAAFDLLDRLGAEDPLGQNRRDRDRDRHRHRDRDRDGDGDGDHTETDWDAVVEPFIGGAAVLFVSGYGDGDDGDPSGAVIFRASDAPAAAAVILEHRSDGFAERDYRNVSYKVMEEGGVIAVMGEHLVYAANEPTLHAIVDTHLGDTRPLADSDDFRRLRNDLSGEALAFVYLDPAPLMAEALDEVVAEEGPDILSLLGLDGLVSRPLGVLVRQGEGAFHVRAAALGDPGSIVPLLRPRDSRFAELAPAETAIFVSIYDIAGVLDEVRGEGGLLERFQDALLETADEDGQLARLEDLLSLLDGELALAIWLPDDVEEAGFVLLAEVEAEDRARELLGELLADSLEAGDIAMSVEDGVAAIGSSAEAIASARGGDGPSLASSERYSTTVAALDAPLASFAYVDIWRFFASTEDEFDGLDLDGDALGFIVNLLWENDRVQVEAALTIAPAE